MHLPLTPLDLLSLRLADIRLDIGTRLSFVTRGMKKQACDELIEIMAHVQYASEREVMRDAAEKKQQLPS